MPVLGKEVEPRLSPDQIAVQEVQNYVEKIERQAETQQQAAQQQPQQDQTKINQIQSDMGKTVSGQFSATVKPKIVLPIDQNTIQTGLKKDVSLGIKWLSEWCVMMIKKYPGRVFYMPPQNQ